MAARYGFCGECGAKYVAGLSVLRALLVDDLFGDYHDMIEMV